MTHDPSHTHAGREKPCNINGFRPPSLPGSRPDITSRHATNKHCSADTNAMRFFAALSILALLPCCVHQVSTSAQPIDGVVRSHTGTPVRGARVWAYFYMPSGLMKPSDRVAFGPAITGHDGHFRIDLHPIQMTQTHTILDGDPCPNLIVVHKDLGAFGLANINDVKDLPFTVLQYSEPDPNISIKGTFGIISELPPESRRRAEAYLGIKSPLVPPQN